MREPNDEELAGLSAPDDDDPPWPVAPSRYVSPLEAASIIARGGWVLVMAAPEDWRDADRSAVARVALAATAFRPGPPEALLIVGSQQDAGTVGLYLDGVLVAETHVDDDEADSRVFVHVE